MKHVWRSAKTTTDLSEFLSESVEFHLRAVSPVLGGTSGGQCLLQLGLQVSQVSLETALVVVQVGDGDRQLADSRRQFTYLGLGVLPSALRLHSHAVISTATTA